MATVKAVFYLPLRDSDGRSLKNERKELLAELYDYFDGWTSERLVTGVYRMAHGSRAFDVSAKYAVIMDEGRVKELEDLLRAFKKNTLQEAIYLEIQRHVDIHFIR